MMATYAPIMIALALLGYVLLKLRLNRIAQPLRLQLADRGEALLADPNLPLHRRHFVEFELEGAFGRAGMLLFGFLAIPFLAVWCAVDSATEDDQYISNDAVRGRADEFDDLSTRIGFLNNPILMPAICAWLAMWFLPATVVGALLGRAVRLLSPIALLAAVHAKRPQLRGN
jgi:hypothetical protein